MAIDNRVKGQDVTILVAEGSGDLLEEFKDISNFSFTDQFEIIAKAYLGQKTQKKDYIYNGVEGSFQMEIPGISFWRFRQRIVDRAQGVAPDNEVNIQFVAAFPNGDVATVAFNDVSFGPMPENVPSRAEYVNVTLAFQVEEAVVSFG